MPRPRFYKLDEQKKTEIISVSAGEFSEQGYDKASFNRIMERLNISKGAMYYYFDDKADLYRTVMKNYYEPCHKALWQFEIDTSNSERFWLTLEEVCSKNLVNLSQNDHALHLYKHLIHGRYDDNSCDVLKEMFSSLAEWCQKIIGDGQRAGLIRTDMPTDLLVMVFLGVGEAIENWSLSRTPAKHIRENPEQVELYASKLVDIFRRIATP